MALTMAERADLATSEGPYKSQVTATLSKHAVHTLITNTADADYLRLARSVAHYPQGYAERFGLAALTRHELAGVEGPEGVDDGVLLTVIAEHLFPVFAPPPD